MRTRKPKPFAHGTGVAVERTRSEIEALVERHGGRQFFSGWKDDHKAVVGFRAQDRIVRLELPLKLEGKVTAAQAGAEMRRRWRCLLFALKAQFTVVETGIKTFEQAFFADIVTATDQTVYEAAHAAVAEMYRTGKVARMLGPAVSGPAEYEPPAR
jgi:hypothetical protein